MRSEPSSTRAHTVFLNEINQASKLNHPNITAILDFAETTAEDAQHESGLIRPNQPWIAMELARRGSLDQLESVLTWNDLFGICQSLLSGLANAHARGILHRDIKPGNILLGSPEDFRPNIKLSDFGLALTHSEVVSPGTGLRVVGTPEYMAPEQIEGLWRDQGPWTDLYSLGCVAYELASGWPPFTGETHREVVLGHLSSPPPPLRAMNVLPEGFEGWLSRMLSKEPVERFQSAADAAHALNKINRNAETNNPLPGRKAPNSASPTWTFMDIDLPRSRRVRAPSGPAIHPEDAPNLVSDWRALAPDKAALPLTNASLSLVGVKRTQIIGRHSERDKLWTALHEVAHNGYPRAVMLKGKSGYGKQRLAQWLSETAHEAGMAQVLVAEHSPIPTPGHGLPRMFAELFHTRDLHGAEVLERTTHMMKQLGLDDSYEAQALSRLLLSTSGAISTSTTLPTGALSERLGIYERIIERMTEHRPVVIVLKNVQWAIESLKFTARLMRSRGTELPVLFVMTCDSEAALQRQHEMRQIESIEALPSTDIITVEPMAESETIQLITELLNVEPDLARELAERSEGSPLFAIQMMEDLVERSLLEMGTTGFRLKASAPRSLPATIQVLWRRRLDASLQSIPASGRDALRVGAALGATVDVDEWSTVCAAMGVDIPATLLSKLARTGLVDIRESGWAFAHGLLRESIAAENEDVWAEINLACAKMLNAAPNAPGNQGRIGQHLLAAGKLEESLPFLHQGARQDRQSGVYDGALHLLDAQQGVLDTLAIPTSDSRWGDLWHQRLVNLYNLRRLDTIETLAQRLFDAAKEHAWTDLLPIATRWRAHIATYNNQFDEALELFAQAESMLKDSHEQELGHILRNWALLLRRIGRAVEAESKLNQAADIFEKLDATSEFAMTRYHQAALQNVLFQDQEKALQLLEEAQTLHSEQNDYMGVGDCWNGIAEIHRAKGNLADAEEAYAKSELFFRRAGIDTEVVPKLNRGLLQLQRDHFDDAKVLLTEIQNKHAHGSWGALMPCVHAGLMLCAAATAQWDEWEVHEESLRDALEKSPMVERDLAVPLERAANIAQVEGKTTFAVRTWHLAQEQWRAIGDKEAVERIKRRLAAHL